MGSFCVSLLLCFFGVLSARKGSLERLCEQGKDGPNIRILKVREGGNGSLDLQLNTTEQIKVCKCDPDRKNCLKELFVGLVGKLHRRTNETRISLINGTFTVQIAERADEGLYIITPLLNEDTILVAVNLTVDEPPVPSPDLPSSTDTPQTVPKGLVIGLVVGVIIVVVGVAAAAFVIAQKCMKKRRHNESSSSTSTANWMVKWIEVKLLRCFVNRTTPEDFSKLSTGSNTVVKHESGCTSVTVSCL